MARPLFCLLGKVRRCAYRAAEVGLRPGACKAQGYSCIIGYQSLGYLFSLQLPILCCPPLRTSAPIPDAGPLTPGISWGQGGLCSTQVTLGALLGGAGHWKDHPKTIHWGLAAATLHSAGTEPLPRRPVEIPTEWASRSLAVDEHFRAQRAGHPHSTGTKLPRPGPFRTSPCASVPLKRPSVTKPQQWTVTCFPGFREPLQRTMPEPQGRVVGASRS